MALCFALCLAIMTVIRLLKPLPSPIVFKQQTTIALETSGSAKLAGALVILIALILYVVFSPIGLIR
jgi:SSS family solute:Na+ symporter